MLKYTEMVLQKVSFNKDLFTRELKKSLKWLKRDEAIILKSWCVLHFGSVYSDVIHDVFS